ncbi:MAG: dTDP-glucose 4,6-dehydratase [Nitrososphaerota archaeon]
MRLLVTGGLGFIGSNFILYALEKYPRFKIMNIDACLSGSNLRNLAGLRNKNYNYYKGNITNKKIIDKLVSSTDVVINFAAESHVDRSIIDAKPFINSNIIGVYTILESIKKHRKKMIHISTDEVFGSLKRGSANESYPLNPSSPYASSKASAELLVKSYFSTYNCDTIIARCTNNFGPRQSPEKFIPKVILLAEKNKNIPIYGTGKNIRDWIFVLDHCEAILRILFKGKTGESYNIAGKNELDNITVVKKILEIMGKSQHLIWFTNDRPGHDFRYSLDSKKITRELGWRPIYEFEKGLNHTISWYLKNMNWRKSISSKDMLTTLWKDR